jgi:hypothetical protein
MTDKVKSPNQIIHEAPEKCGTCDHYRKPSDCYVNLGRIHADDDACELWAEKTPVMVDSTLCADKANKRYGDRYGVDWVYKA